jgi:hypothetical protein
MSNERLYLVCEPSRLQFHQPTHRHPNYASAIKEAERLARAHPGQAFHVLVSMQVVVKNDIQTMRFSGSEYVEEDDCGIPF